MKRKTVLIALQLNTVIFANCCLIHLLLPQTLSLWIRLLLFCISLALFCFFQLIPFPRNSSVPLRLTVMMGGRTLCYASLWGFILQLLIIFFLYPRIKPSGPPHLLWINTIIALVVYFVMMWNGILRIFFTSYRLRLVTRLLMFLFMWIPVVNLFTLLYALRKVHEEYDFGSYQAAIRQIRAESDLCQTKYPLLMVHGVGFRDLKYFNYWGRIPRELTRYGAAVYYGNQEAFGTIANNARDIKDKILEIVQETGCEKVNIIAHSKGGLDSRYAISCLEMDPYVATLTTMNTPHRGCRFVDYAIRLPDPLYRFVAKQFDRMFYRFGDRNPDFYTATKQFSTGASKQFNESVPDSANVYYQSYTSVMKYFFSHLLLALPFCLIYLLEGANDGLVSVTSAKWGDFKGIYQNHRWRGVSHADIIDLKREDYKGFDVIEVYVGIVSDLKNKGF